MIRKPYYGVCARTAAAVLCALMLAVLLAGCNLTGGGQDNTYDGTADSTAAAAPETSRGTETGSATEPVTEPATEPVTQPATEPATEPQPPSPPDPPVIDAAYLFPAEYLPESCTLPLAQTYGKSRGSGFYEVNVPTPSVAAFPDMMQVYSGGGTALVEYSYFKESATDSYVTSVDLATGKVLGQAVFTGGYYSFSVLDDGRVAVIGENATSVSVYTPELKQTGTTRNLYAECGFTETYLGGMGLTGDGKYFFCHSWEDGKIYLCDLSDSPVKPRITETGTDSLIWESVSGNDIYYTVYGIDGYKLRLDAGDGTVTRLFGDPGINFSVSDGLGTCYTDKLYKILRPAADIIAVIPSSGGSESNLFIGRSLIISTRFDVRTSVYAYDLSRQKRYSAIADEALPDGYYINDITCPDSGCALLACADSNGNYKLMLWDFRDESLLQDAVTYETEIYLTGDLESVTADFAAQTYEKTGVRILYGSYGNDFNAGDYLAAVHKNPVDNFNAVRIVGDTLAQYPEGIFGEMCVDSVKRIDIYLCGQLSNITSSGISSAAGIAFSDVFTRCIALDVNYCDSLHRSLTHELMHVMEDRLAQYAGESCPDLIANWTDFVPPGSSGFYMSYHDSKGNEMNDYSNTAEGGSSDSKVWFIDAYSKSYPTEDRARIMENLFAAAEQPNPNLRGANLLRKARYLCTAIRLAFPSVAACDNVIWESEITLIPGEFDALLTLKPAA